MVRDKADVILHPVRLRIIQTLATAPSRDGLSARELGPALPDVPQASLYRHLGRLAEAGVLRVAAERPVGGKTERVYQLANASLASADLSRRTRDEQLEGFATFLGTLLGDYARYLRRETIDLERDGVGYHQYVAHLSDAEFAAFIARITELIGSATANAPAPGRTPRLVNLMLMPAGAELPPAGTKGGPA